MDKEDIVWIYNILKITNNTMEYYSAIKKWNNAICSVLGEYRYYIVLCEVQKKQILYDVADMWNLLYDTNELINKTETDSKI